MAARWRKLHLEVDSVTHDIVAAEVSLENVHDAEVSPTLLTPLRRKLGRVYTDGAYDSKASCVNPLVFSQIEDD